jgi:hypothetical protein
VDPLWPVVAGLIGLATLPGTLELMVLSVAAALGAPERRRRQALPTGDCGWISVVVPAHDEEAGIGETLRSVQAAIQADGRSSLLVVGANSTDATAANAADVRQDPVRRGKGFALRHAWETLRSEPIGAMAVVDADSVVERNFVSEIRKHLSGDGDAVQARFRVRNTNASVRTRLLQLALTAMNVVRPLGRERLGCSAGLYGNGFAVRRETLELVPLPGPSLTEDLDYHVRLVLAGRRVRFVDSTVVWSDMPTTGRDAEAQRARWEGGRLYVARRWALPLAREVARGRLALLEPLADLLLLPLGYHALLLLGLLALPWLPGRIGGAAALGVLAFHLAVAAKLGGRLRDLGILAAAPAYLVWKLLLLPRTLRASRADAPWVRGSRGADPTPPGRAS